MRKNQILPSFLFLSWPFSLFCITTDCWFCASCSPQPSPVRRLSHLKILPWVLTQPHICSLHPLLKCSAPDQLLTCLADLRFQSPCCRRWEPAPSTCCQVESLEDRMGGVSGVMISDGKCSGTRWNYES